LSDSNGAVDELKYGERLEVRGTRRRVLLIKPWLIRAGRSSRFTPAAVGLSAISIVCLRE
jgi:hypothetical protein